MKLLSIKILPVLILFTISVSAQLSSNPSALHGSYKKGDTTTEYEDKPQMHSHEQVTIIKEKKLTPAEAAKVGLKVPPYMQHKSAGKASADSTSTPDTTAQAAAVPTDTQNTTPPASIAENTLIVASGCDCINRCFLIAALILLGLGYLFDLYLLMQTMRDEKRSGFASAIHGLLASAGMTLLIVYSIFQITPVISLSLLAIAVLLGVVLLYNDIAGKPSSKGFVIGQATIAAVGFVLLIIFALAH